ncbi:hypothetical protein J2W57_002518 [Chryseobacterium ginsenosidimutans]|uniref:Uncharacterized protein n=1 Tax=Chryseobacterium geocarposphaerae TaxID=1416776 RepID=A0ABU1LG40_9FLAO|nr:hypothetical protein [Chryseobacterium geocarposphaerae]MDR6699141.1 hypothetical protein [Chryseobacterium ginsenosidimutans]
MFHRKLLWIFQLGLSIDISYMKLNAKPRFLGFIFRLYDVA